MYCCVSPGKPNVPAGDLEEFNKKKRNKIDEDNQFLKDFLTIDSKNNDNPNQAQYGKNQNRRI